jgi:hypothetical protein
MEHIGCEDSLLYPHQKGTFRDMDYSRITGDTEAIHLTEKPGIGNWLRTSRNVRLSVNCFRRVGRWQVSK